MVSLHGHNIDKGRGFIVKFEVVERKKVGRNLVSYLQTKRPIKVLTGCLLLMKYTLELV